MKKIEKIFFESALITHGPEEMHTLGRLISEELEAGDVLGFVGDLGAGKTHLIQGILQGLGASQPAASPTYSLVHEHHDGRIPVAHFDFYRLNKAEEAINMGWDEYLDSGSILLVEWADRFDGILMPEETCWLVLRHVEQNKRSITCPQLLR